MKESTALKCCYAGVAVTLVLMVVEFVVFQRRLVHVPEFGFFPLIVVTLAPAILGVAIYQKALKPK